jgi:hypothetical protein
LFVFSVQFFILMWSAPSLSNPVTLSEIAACFYYPESVTENYLKPAVPCYFLSLFGIIADIAINDA